jgi:hypothetical protein
LADALDQWSTSPLTDAALEKLIGSVDRLVRELAHEVDPGWQVSVEKNIRETVFRRDGAPGTPPSGRGARIADKRVGRQTGAGVPWWLAIAPRNGDTSRGQFRMTAK